MGCMLGWSLKPPTWQRVMLFSACHAIQWNVIRFFIWLNSKNIFMSCICGKWLKMYENVMHMICQKTWLKKCRIVFQILQGFFFRMHWKIRSAMVSLMGSHPIIPTAVRIFVPNFWHHYSKSLCTTPNIKHLWRVKKWTPFRENWWFTYKISKYH